MRMSQTTRIDGLTRQGDLTWKRAPHHNHSLESTPHAQILKAQKEKLGFNTDCTRYSCKYVNKWQVRDTKR
jgi:hypothetical protein